MLREPQHRLRLDAGARAPGDVVEREREPRRVGDLQEVRLDGVLRRLAVVGRDHQQGVGARLFGLQRHLDGVPGGEAADPRDDRCPVADRLGDGPHQRGLLAVGRGGGLAGGAREHEPVAAVGHQALGEQLGAVQVEQPVVREGRDHRAEGAAEGGCGDEGEAMEAVSAHRR